MATASRTARKREALRRQGTLHAHPRDVTNPLFRGSVFFDPDDVMQVKYEMLRAVRRDRVSVSQAAADFGLSRPAYYQAQEAFERKGILGLLPRKRGPHGAHKLTDEIVQHLADARTKNPNLRLNDLVTLVQERFGLRVHPRSIERRLAQFHLLEKKTTQ